MALNLTKTIGDHEYRVVFNANADALVFLIDGKQMFVK